MSSSQTCPFVALLDVLARPITLLAVMSIVYLAMMLLTRDVAVDVR